MEFFEKNLDALEKEIIDKDIGMGIKKLKVMQIIPVLNYGGIESHRYLIAKYHNPDDYELSFCCLSETGITAKKIEKLGYQIFYLHENVKIPNFNLLISLYRLFCKEQPDVVHACAAEANFHAMIAAYLAKIPVRIAEEVGLPGQSKKARLIFRSIYALSSAVIGVSKTVQEYLIDKNGVTPKKVKLIYNPYDMDLYKEYRIKDNVIKKTIDILSVGRLVEDKNHIMLIKSFARVHEKYPNLFLKIVGEGQLRETLQRLIRSLEMQDRIYLLGYKDDIPKLLQNSDLFILPSKSEGLGIALIEAMAMGIPVIGTDVGGIPEVIVEDQSMGWIVPNNDMKSMAKTIEDVIKLSKEEKNTITNNAKKYVEEKFSPYSYMVNLDNLYKGMM